jgi:hypothetical protein
VNCEKTWWTDPRRFDLIEKLGDEELADGAMLKAWKLSQDFWADNRRKVPLSEFMKLRFASQILSAGLAVRNQKRVYVKGSSSYHEWLHKNKANGVKGAELRWKNKRKAISPPNGDPNSESIASTSTSFSPSVSCSISKEKTKNKELNPSGGVVKPTRTGTELNRKIWESYREAYHDRYGTDPVRNATVNGQISQVGKRLGEEAPQVASFFLSHGDSFYLKNMHAVGLLLKDAEKLRTEWITNRKVNGTSARTLERRDTNVEAMREYVATKERGERLL